ncbi:hypothetical protein K505DRAFT_73228 [Melanomma pulvis-pyrius CBS 109.77]|uniref:Uncharacterized protein n=1 Tax=Melanomma pulvis-pyrius CBS 109.77 TaxID=1314802 RepID=A0A6A6X485_9PLEO|nr:hypothetical protein K505DRAFT_73228 [Melanomma pulvis-pyrius CBS 109.77]
MGRRLSNLINSHSTKVRLGRRALTKQRLGRCRVLTQHPVCSETLLLSLRVSCARLFALQTCRCPCPSLVAYSLETFFSGLGYCTLWLIFEPLPSAFPVTVPFTVPSWLHSPFRAEAPQSFQKPIRPQKKQRESNSSGVHTKLLRSTFVCML